MKSQGKRKLLRKISPKSQNGVWPAAGAESDGGGAAVAAGGTEMKVPSAPPRELLSAPESDRSIN